MKKNIYRVQIVYTNVCDTSPTYQFHPPITPAVRKSPFNFILLQRENEIYYVCTIESDNHTSIIGSREWFQMT